jgi:hypothetical protein
MGEASSKEIKISWISDLFDDKYHRKNYDERILLFEFPVHQSGLFHLLFHI